MNRVHELFLDLIVIYVLSSVCQHPKYITARNLKVDIEHK